MKSLKSPNPWLSTALVICPVLAASGPVDGLNAADDGTAQEEAEREVKRTWHAELGAPAPDFELTALDGSTWKLSAQRGKSVVLEWFNPDCPIVQAAHGEGGALQGVGNRLSKQDGIVWVAINSGAPGKQGSGQERNDKAKKQMGLEYPMLLDESGWVGAMYEARTTPHMVVVDPKGKLVYTGAHDDKQTGTRYVEKALASVRAGKKVESPRTKAYGCNVKYTDKAKLGLVGPDFTLHDLEGNEVSLSSMRGKPVVLEWFNPDCPVVKKAHGADGALEGTAARATAKGVAWAAINSGAPGKQGTGVERNGRAAAAWSLEHPILLDEEGKVGKAYGAETTPHMYVLDERGVLVYQGGHTDNEGTNLVERALEEVLAGQEVSHPSTRNFGCGVKYGS